MTDTLDSKEYSLDDIAIALDENDTASRISSEEAVRRPVTQTPNAVESTLESELDILSRALNNFTDDPPSKNTFDEAEEGNEADQLLADIDDMLADLTVHLDSIIPGSSSQSKSHP